MSVATDAVNSVVNTLQTIAAVKGKVFHVLTEEEMIARASVIPFPAVGVLYEGMRATGGGGGSHRTGLAAELGIAIVVLYKHGPGMGKEAEDKLKPDALMVLDTIRNLFRDTTGPSGKFWQFVAEMPAAEKGNLVAWVQRWSLPVTLTTGL